MLGDTTILSLWDLDNCYGRMFELKLNCASD